MAKVFINKLILKMITKFKQNRIKLIKLTVHKTLMRLCKKLWETM